MFTLYVGDQKIGKVHSVKAEGVSSEPSLEISKPQEFSFGLVDVDPEFIKHINNITGMSIEVKDDPRLHSKVLGHFFKEIRVDRKAYKKMSQAKTRMEQLNERK